MEICGTKVKLVECNKKLWHEFYENYVGGSALGDAFYRYDYEAVQNDYSAKTGDNTRLYFFILAENRVVGQIYLKRMDRAKRTTEFGIALINDSVKGMGYGSEAISLLINYAFGALGFEKILADTLLENYRSQHVLKKQGFVFKSQDSNFKYYGIESKANGKHS